MQFTTSQVLTIVGISRRTLQNWLSEGKLPKVKHQGKQRIWTAEDVKRLMQLKHGQEARRD
jgi:excisionase family DNA binding protein